jgi:acyl carrier protein
VAQKQSNQHELLLFPASFACYHQGKETKQALITKLSALSPDERLTFVATRLRERLAKVLQLPAAKIELQQSSNQLGIDSLMALELKQELDLEFGVEIPTMQILKGATVTQMAKLLLDKMASL